MQQLKIKIQACTILEIVIFFGSILLRNLRILDKFMIFEDFGMMSLLMGK